MKLVNPTEHAIYAAAYARALGLPEWTERAADLAILAAERAVELHRDAIRRRNRS